MKSPFRLLVLLVLVSVAWRSLGAQPPEGSHLASDENACAMCHGEADLWSEENLHRFISEESLAQDVHFLKGVNCHDCHGGDPSAFDPGDLHAKEDGFRELKDVWNACGQCHKDEAVELRRGVHAKAGERDERGRGTPLNCSECHGDKAHGMLPVRDKQSPVVLEHQVKTCGRCHEKYEKTYARTVHGNGLYQSGLVVTAVCADCHGPHGIYYAADRRSTLHRSRVTETCCQCHKFISEQVQQSVHGRERKPGAAEEALPPVEKRKPSCTDCHQGHVLLNLASAPNGEEVLHLCGNCHADQSSGYAKSLHGQLTRLGYQPAASCSDCHGGHNILAVRNSDSQLAAGANRLETCGKCHRRAVANFSNFDPHANHKDAQTYPTLHAVYAWVVSPLNLIFCLFAIHAFLWFLRSLIQTLQHGKHRTLVTKEFALVRFEQFHQLSYPVMIISPLGLMLTGMSLRFGEQSWARSLADTLGGFQSISIWHHLFAVLLLVVCCTHLVVGAIQIYRRYEHGDGFVTIFFGPDSLVPRLRDVKDVLGMVRWFFGLGRKPGFERWTYWEKMDYWAVFAAVVLIGTSGMVLWFPNFFCVVFPGKILNVAKMIHSDLALYAVGVLLFVHIFNTHFRPEKFPIDLSMLTGLVSESHLRGARPEYVERLHREGKLDELRRPAPSRKGTRLVLATGCVVFLLGLTLLAAVLLASLGE